MFTQVEVRFDCEKMKQVYFNFKYIYLINKKRKNKSFFSATVFFKLLKVPHVKVSH